MASIRFRLSYANVVSTIALFAVVTGGGAYAAATIGPSQIKKNAVRAKHINKDAVRARQIKEGMVRTEKIAPDAVGQDQLANAAVGNAEIANFAVGSTKLALGSVFGDHVANGSLLGDDLANATVTAAKIAPGSIIASRMATITRRSDVFTVGASSEASGSASCNGLERMLSGGGDGPNGVFYGVKESFPASNSSWSVRAYNTSGSPATYSVYVLCLATT